MECVCSTIAETVLNSRASGGGGDGSVTGRMGGIRKGRSFPIMQRFPSRIMVISMGNKTLTSVVLH